MTAPLTIDDRRRAALERLHGPTALAPVPARRKASSPVTTDATRRWLRSASKKRITPAEARARLGAARAGRSTRTAELGPPTGTYYAIAAVVAVFVMLGLVMVLSASAVTEANLGHSPYLEVHGATATGRWGWTALVNIPGFGPMQAGGVYHDDYVSTDEGWKTSEARISLAWRPESPL